MTAATPASDVQAAEAFAAHCPRQAQSNPQSRPFYIAAAVSAAMTIDCASHRRYTAEHYG